MTKKSSSIQSQRQPRTCTAGTFTPSDDGITNVGAGRLAAAIVVDFDLSKSHYDAIKAAAGRFKAFKIAGQTSRGFLIVFDKSYQDKDECARQVQSFLIALIRRIDRRPAATWNSPFDNSSTRAQRVPEPIDGDLGGDKNLWKLRSARRH